MRMGRKLASMKQRSTTFCHLSEKLSHQSASKVLTMGKGARAICGAIHSAQACIPASSGSDPPSNPRSAREGRSVACAERGSEERERGGRGRERGGGQGRPRRGRREGEVAQQRKIESVRTHVHWIKGIRIRSNCSSYNSNSNTSSNTHAVTHTRSNTHAQADNAHGSPPSLPPSFDTCHGASSPLAKCRRSGRPSTRG